MNKINRKKNYGDNNGNMLIVSCNSHHPIPVPVSDIYQPERKSSLTSITIAAQVVETFVIVIDDNCWNRMYKDNYHRTTWTLNKKAFLIQIV